MCSAGGRSAANTQRQGAASAAKEEPEVSTSMCDGTMKRATEYRPMDKQRDKKTNKES